MSKSHVTLSFSMENNHPFFFPLDAMRFCYDEVTILCPPPFFPNPPPPPPPPPTVPVIPGLAPSCRSLCFNAAFPEDLSVVFPRLNDDDRSSSCASMLGLIEHSSCSLSNCVSSLGLFFATSFHPNVHGVNLPFSCDNVFGYVLPLRGLAQSRLLRFFSISVGSF